jgi:hypothetical protein
MAKQTITYRCGYQKEEFIFASEEDMPQRLAELARTLCHFCQIAQEQKQFEEALQQAHEVYNVTDQNGCLITATCTRPGYCKIIRQHEGEAPFYVRELEIAQVTAELYQRGHKGLYWSKKRYTYKPLD